eukprot:6205522-Pleurochrysis_carterae.AAC.1
MLAVETFRSNLVAPFCLFAFQDERARSTEIQAQMAEMGARLEHALNQNSVMRTELVRCASQATRCYAPLLLCIWWRMHGSCVQAYGRALARARMHSCALQFWAFAKTAAYPSPAPRSLALSRTRVLNSLRQRFLSSLALARSLALPSLQPHELCAKRWKRYSCSRPSLSPFRKRLPRFRHPCVMTNDKRCGPSHRRECYVWRAWLRAFRTRCGGRQRG